MFEINLLPLRLRQRRKIAVEQIRKTKITFFVLVSLVLFHLFLQTSTLINAKKLSRLNSRWENLSAEREQIEQLENELMEVYEKFPLIEQLIKNRVLWSKVLNKISDLVIPGIWLTELNLESRQARLKEKESCECLIIRGSAASGAKDEPALIGRFMQNLKDEPSFSTEFAEIELGPIKKRQIKQTEIMDFTLVCCFKPLKAQTLVQ